MNNATKATNGTASTEVKAEAKTTPVVSIDLKKNPAKEVSKPSPLSLDIQLEKMNVLYDLSQKRDKLLETKNNLSRFKTASDERTNTLDLSDGKGSDFTTHNPQVIGEIIELIKKDIATKLNIVEEQIIAVG